MLTIAITGGYATGKSTVAKMFCELGADLVSADEIVKKLYQPHSEIWRKIKDRFGEGILTAEAEIDRNKLGHLVFNDGKIRKELNAIVHPAVIEDIDTLIKRKEAAGAAVLVAEIPLLFEEGLVANFNRVIVVACNEKTQIDHASVKDKLSIVDIQRRMKSQWPLEVKIEEADYVINNNGTKEELKRKIVELWTLIKEGNHEQGK